MMESRRIRTQQALSVILTQRVDDPSVDPEGLQDILTMSHLEDESGEGLRREAAAILRVLGFAPTEESIDTLIERVERLKP